MPGEKTEKATPKKRKTQRQKGNVVQSQDIVSAFVLLAIFGLLKLFGRQYMNDMATGMEKLFSAIPTAGSSNIKTGFIIVAIISAQIVVPIMAVNIIVSVFVTMAQTRFLFVFMKPNFSRINPITGFKNLFSIKSLVELVKSLAKIIVIGLLMFISVRPEMPRILSLYNANPHVAVSYSCGIIIDACIKGSIALLGIGVMDIFFQWWDYERRMRMSKQELKDEYKELEGSPETKSRIRGEQRRISRMRMMSAVPKADVVIRNPTHYAVALKYDRERSNAPVVVAKGKNAVALRIVELAEASKVYITENVPLAQALYKTVEIGQEIPAEFYKAVAEILAYIYKLRRAGRQ